MWISCEMCESKENKFNQTRLKQYEELIQALFSSPLFMFLLFLEDMFFRWFHHQRNLSYILQEMSQAWAPKKPNFGVPPPGYVAGLGRGATGFITRSDLGPSRLPEASTIKAAETEQVNYNEAKFDQWEGFEGALFSKGALDEEDKQAEQAYDFCERRVWERRARERAEQEQEAKGKELTDHSVTAKFVDLKRELAKVSTEEWESIPECVDLSIKKRKKDKYTPVPDSLVINLLASRQAPAHREQEEEDAQDFREAKEVLLRSKLDRAEHQTVGQSNVDRVGYITELNSRKLDADFLGDVKKARVLLKSALASNPKNPDIWLSAARVEELDGKIKDCRQVLRKAIEACPLSEDLWMELSRIEKPEQAKDVLIEGLRFLPSSEKLWLFAARREDQNKQLKSKILRKGLESVPTSVRLWRELIEMESVSEAKNLLYKAVESLPRQIDLWLALAKVEDYKNAQKVLNKARKCNPLSLAIWISAARLEQAQAQVDSTTHGLGDRVQNILSKGRDILRKNGANISREEWLEEAWHAEGSASPVVCERLVKLSVSLGLAQEEVKNVVQKDVQFYEKERGANLTTRFLFHYGVLATRSQELMREMLEFQNRRRQRKEHDQLQSTLKFALQVFKDDPRFWQATIDRLLREADYTPALALITEALPRLEPAEQQQFRLQRVRIFTLQGQIEAARSELAALRQAFPKGPSVTASIRFEYELSNYEPAWNLCSLHFRQSRSEELWRLAFRIRLKNGSYDEARTIIDRAIEAFPTSEAVWLDAVELEVTHKQVSRARARLDKAMQKVAKSEELALVTIELQRKFGTRNQANFAIVKALKAFPRSPPIWAAAIELEPPNTRKKKASSAIEVCGQSAYLNSSVAKLFWKEGKLDKAKKWLQESLKMAAHCGDIWALYLRLLHSNFPNELPEAQQRFLQVEDPIEGRLWLREVNGQAGWKLTRLQILENLSAAVDGQIAGLD